MSDDGEIDSPTKAEDLAFEAWEVGERDPSDAMLAQRIEDDLDLPLTPLLQDGSELGGRDGNEKEDSPLSEEEKSEALGYPEPEKAREELEGDAELAANTAINSHSEIDSHPSSDVSKQESTTPIEKPNVTDPDASRNVPAETSTQEEASAKGDNDQNRPLKAPSQGLERIYRQAAPVIQNPYGSTQPPCTRRSSSGRTVHEYAKPDASRRPLIRSQCTVSSTNPYGLDPGQWEVNTAATVPMKARPWKRKVSGWRKPRPSALEEWKQREGALMQYRDCDLATRLGYETRVGNLVHIHIPGGRDLNRSWRHFLQQDAMSWGFPYWKGSTERPQPPVPPPYLVHELKAKFWKNPRVRSYKSA